MKQLRKYAGLMKRRAAANVNRQASSLSGDHGQTFAFRADTLRNSLVNNQHPFSKRSAIPARTQRRSNLPSVCLASWSALLRALSPAPRECANLASITASWILQTVKSPSFTMDYNEGIVCHANRQAWILRALASKFEWTWTDSALVIFDESVIISEKQLLEVWIIDETYVYYVLMSR